MKLTGNLGHQGPPNTLSSQKEKLDTITCKIINIEQKIVTAPPKAGNPPGLQTKNPKTKGQGAKQKGTEATPKYWYHKDLKDFSTKRLVLWAAVISVGKWGRPINDQPKPFNHKCNDNREAIQAYIKRTLQYHFGPGKLNCFPSAPPADRKISSGWTKSFNWEILNYNREVISCSQKTPVYPAQPYMKIEGKDQCTTMNPLQADKGKQRMVETPVAEVEDPWIETPRGGLMSCDSSKPKQISFTAAAAATKPKITAPQPKYDNVPTTWFVTPMSKRPAKHTGNYGKRYMIKFHMDKKPLPGTAMPIQAIISEINRTCGQFHIKANSAKWTPAMNLTIFFTHDSIDPQIEKARNTILGVLAKGTNKSLFIKSTKWSRIVVRDVPTQKWVTDENAPTDQDLGAPPPGEFIQVTDAELKEEIRKSHPILADTIFVSARIFYGPF